MNNYINKTYVIELFSEYFCGKDDCSGNCQNCIKGKFTDKILNDKNNSKD